MNLDPALVDSVRVLCALNGNPYMPTGRTCAECGGNDEVNDLPQYQPHTFCAEHSVASTRGTDRKLLSAFADVLKALGIDFTGVPVVTL